MSDTKSEEISIQDLIRKAKSLIRYIKHKWLLILTISTIGAALGLAYAIIKKPKYIASCTFVLEDGNKAGGLGQYAGLASIAGLDIGGGGGGVFQGDNILELYRSRSMIEKTLLTKSDATQADKKLIDIYIEFNDLRKRWTKEEKLSNINFNGSKVNFTRQQDSVITDIVDQIRNKGLSVSKPDKKLTIIRVEYVSKNETFSKEFVEKLVENVNAFYVQTKTKKTERNVKVLEMQRDSVRNILDRSIGGVASAIDATPNANPARSVLRTSSQKKQVDVQASTAIYSEIVKNLEIAKVSLLQETPLIQIIDEPVLPLAIDKLGKLKGALFGFLFGCFLTISFIVVKKAFALLS